MTAPNRSHYEELQACEIQAWKDARPGIINWAMGAATHPLVRLMNTIVPEAAIRGALSLSNAAAVRMTDTADIRRQGKVQAIGDLVGKDLELSDRLANNVHNWAIGIAAAEGTAAGFFGLLSAPVDIPAIITLALRTIHKIGACYGYNGKTQEDERFAYGILAASGANSLEEKLSALAALRAIEVLLAKGTWKKMAERATQTQFTREAAIVAVRNLAKQLGINLTERKALAAIPVIGAGIGGSVNGWYIKDVGWAARRMFQERWLADSGKINVE